MRMIKLTMIESETAVEGEDDTVTVNATTAVAYVNVDTVRSVHARKAQQSDMPRPNGTRIAFVNGSQFAVTESPDEVAALLAPTLN